MSGGIPENTENFIQNSQPLGIESNVEPPGNEATDTQQDYLY